jgi:hypothetical protein
LPLLKLTAFIGNANIAQTSTPQYQGDFVETIQRIIG